MFVPQGNIVLDSGIHSFIVSIRKALNNLSEPRVNTSFFPLFGIAISICKVHSNLSKETSVCRSSY